MNDFKFKDCRDCAHVGRGVLTNECHTCHSGENFEEFVADTLNMMGVEDDFDMEFDIDDDD